MIGLLTENSSDMRRCDRKCFFVKTLSDNMDITEMKC